MKTIVRPRFTEERTTELLNDLYKEGRHNKVNYEKFAKKHKTSHTLFKVLKENNILNEGIWIGKEPSDELIKKVCETFKAYKRTDYEKRCQKLGIKYNPVVIKTKTRKTKIRKSPMTQERMKAILTDLYNSSKNNKIRLNNFRKEHNMSNGIFDVLRKNNIIEHCMWIADAPTDELVSYIYTQLKLYRKKHHTYQSKNIEVDNYHSPLNNEIHNVTAIHNLDSQTFDLQLDNQKQETPAPIEVIETVNDTTPKEGTREFSFGWGFVKIKF